MRCHDFWIFCSVLLSLLFTILTLIPGSKTGLLPNVAIAAIFYSLNDTVVYAHPDTCASSWCPTPFQEVYPTIHDFFFTVHYLGLCAGYMGGTENEEFNHLACEPKKLGWKFTSDDPFIVNFGMIDGVRPVGRVNMSAPYAPAEIETMKGAVPLIIGLVVVVLVVIGLVAEFFGLGKRGGFDLDTGVAALMGVAATSLMLSSVLVTRMWFSENWHPYLQDDSVDWVMHLVAFSWSAMGFMYAAFIGKVVDKVWTKEKRRRLLRTGQI